MVPPPLLGNHEYRGNTQAVLDYAGVSRRWMMPARYYTRVFDEDGFSLRLVWLDTTPLISKYRSDEKYADAGMQDDVCQLAWADSVLSSAREDWVVVMDHHPVYAHTYHPAQASCRDVRVWTYSQFPALEGEGQRCGLCGEFCGFPVARAGGGGGHRVL